jgi:hypothetical protein
MPLQYCIEALSCLDWNGVDVNSLACSTARELSLVQAMPSSPELLPSICQQVLSNNRRAKLCTGRLLAAYADIGEPMLSTLCFVAAGQHYWA